MGKLTLEEIQNHPAYKTVVPELKPTIEGDLVVAKTRDGACAIHYEVHGTGPIKTVWIQGLNGPAIAWWRQTQYFGHLHSSKYSVLVLDNRGVGRSHKPIRRYNTYHMAHDLLEVLDHLGWNEPNSLHVTGISMGGMIAQELALIAPERFASLTLQSTAAKLDIFSQSPLRRLSFLVPKSELKRLEVVQDNIFAKEWLDAPDDKGEFPTNSDRFVAEEIWRRKNLQPPVFMGYLMQALAAAMHNMSPERCVKIKESVPRMFIMHGDKDEMISVKHGEDILKYMGGESETVKWKKFEGVGHCIFVEKSRELNEVMEQWFAGDYKG